MTGLTLRRLRPWYMGASAGFKDIIIVLDASGSMSKGDRMGLAQTAAKTLIAGLTQGDYVNVIVVRLTYA
jgi:Mg-chelatase subunit ChlD